MATSSKGCKMPQHKCRMSQDQSTKKKEEEEGEGLEGEGEEVDSNYS